MKVIFEITNHRSRIVDCPSDLKEYLYEKLAVLRKGLKWSNAYRMGLWDGMTHYFSKATAGFKTGLLSWATKCVAERYKDIEIFYKDLREKPAKKFDVKHLIVLRDYQQDVLKECVHSTRGIIYAATGSGKTEIALALIAHLGVPTIFIVDNLDILHQTVERAKQNMPDMTIRKIYAGKSELIGKGEPLLTVSTFQTLYKKRHLVHKFMFDMRISDEAHGCAADTWEEVMSYFNSYYSFGLSGSIEEKLEDPERYWAIVGMTGKPIVRIPAHLLVKDGVLALPKVRILRYPVSRARIYSFSDEYRLAVTDNRFLNEGIVPKLVQQHSDQSTLILVNRIEHGRNLSQMLGIPFVCGNDLTETRNAALDEFKTGKRKSLIASKIFKQGIDIPNVEVIISLGCDKSYKMVFQKLGRGLRRTANKSHIIFYDIYPDTGNFMSQHSEYRLKIYRTMGFQYEIRDVKR